MPVYTIEIMARKGANLVLRGNVIAPGEFSTDDICELADLLNNARYEGPAEPPGGRQMVFVETRATRNTIEKWAREAEQQGCPFMRDNLFNAQPAPGGVQDGRPANGDSPQKQGAPDRGQEGGEAIALQRKDGAGAEEAKQYGPLQAEIEKKPHDAPISGEAAQEGTQAGDPVDLFSGAFLLQEADLSVPNSTPPLHLVRTYRSGIAFPGPFSWNWDHNHNVYLRELTPNDPGGVGNVARWSGTLREDVFRWTGAAFEPPRGVFQKLLKLPAGDVRGLYEIQDPGGFSWFFGRPAGWTNAFRIPLMRVVDRFGNALVYTYDAQDRVRRVTAAPVDAAGASSAGPHHFLEFSYGACDLLERVADSLGREVDYWHDPDIQHLVRVRMPATVDRAERTERAYHYGGLHQPDALRHNILRVEDGHGKVYIENEYDEDPASWSFGHLVRQLHGGHPYRFGYTPLQWLPPHEAHINTPTQRTETIDPDGGLTVYTFNYRGDLLDRRTRLAQDGSFWISAVAFEYDAQGNRARTQALREFQAGAGGALSHVWGLGEATEFHHDHADPRMRGLPKLRRLLDGNMAETVWEGVYDPASQLLLSEHGPIGDGFTAAAVTTTYQYGAAPKRKLEKIVHPAATLPDGTVQTAETLVEMNERGQTTAMISAEGTRNEMIYDETPGLAMGRLLRAVADAGAGRTNAETRFDYDARGFLAAATDPAGGVTAYSANELGQVLSVTPPAIGGSAVPTEMRYDADGMLIEIRRPRGAYTDGVITGDHITDTVLRNVLGHVVRTDIGANTALPRVTRRTVDHRGLAVRSVDPLGAVSRWRYDERGLMFLHEVTGPDGATTRGKYVYTRDGRIEQEIHGPAGDTLTRYVYGPFGRIARVHALRRGAGGEEPVGATRRTVYGGRGLVERTELRAWPGLDADELLARTEFRYDSRGRMIERTERPFSAAAPFDDATTPKLTTKFFYDRDDRLVKTADPRGGITTTTFDRLGRVTAVEDPEGNRTEYIYDIVGRSVEIKRRDKEPGAATLRDRTWRRRNDARGRLVEATEPDGAATILEYDDRDLITAAVDRDGTRTEMTYGLLNEPLSETLDPAGLNLRSERIYDIVGRVTSFTDPSGQTTTYAWDGLGRPVSETRPGEAPRTLVYGPDGRLASTTLPSGVVLNYAHDGAGRLASMSAANVPAGVGGIAQHTYTYDLLGRLTGAAAGTSTVTRSWDSLGRLLREVTHGRAMETAYDDLAGTFTRSWPDGRAERVTTNLNGAATKIERTAAGALGAGAALLADFTPYGPAAFGTATLLGGVEASAEYDERMRTTALKYEKAGAAIERARYRYDTNDRRRAELIETGTVQTRLYDFDARDRLVKAREGAATVGGLSVAFTQQDNTTDIATVAASFAAPGIHEYLYTPAPGGRADERLTLVKTPSGGAPASTPYTYAAGHRLQSAGAENFTSHAGGTRASDGLATYEVDALGRVTAAKNPGGASRLALEYDALGRVAAMTPGAGARRAMSYFGGALREESEAGAAVRQFTGNPYMGLPLATHVAGETYVGLGDARLNLLAVTDSAGAVRDRFRYEPFGAPTPATGAVEPRFGGMRWQNDAALFVAGARLMDPRHGAWLAQDPLGYADSPNLYAYAAGNPIDYADPTGLAVEKGGTGGNSDGGMGTGSGPAQAFLFPGETRMGTGKPNLLEGPGNGGPTIDMPGWMVFAARAMRAYSRHVRDKVHGWIDRTFGTDGFSGFIGGFVKGAFNFGVMFVPVVGYSQLEEIVEGVTVMYTAVLDAVFNPDPVAARRLGMMMQAMKEHFAHASASEWGSMTFDLFSSFVGGTGAAKLVGRVGARMGARIGGRFSRVVGRMRNISQYGKRGRNPLTSGEVARVNSYIEKLGLKEKVHVSFSDNMNTGFADIGGTDYLVVGYDVNPGVGPGLPANARVSLEAAVAHELVGHRAAFHAGKTQGVNFMEEAQASIRAARFAPGLSPTERFTLLRDAIERLPADVTIRNIKDQLWINMP